MDKKHFQELLENVELMKRHIRGEPVASREIEIPDPDVRAIRERTGLTQESFALLIGVSKRTLENWEQARRTPTGPARALLRIVAADPAGAIRALRVQPPSQP
jgi:putative transcriptional regulator